MNFHSTRCAPRTWSPDVKTGLDFAEAMDRNMGSDGGLFVPETFPEFTAAELSRPAFLEEGIEAIAGKIARPFLEGSRLAPFIDEICARAFDFPIPLVPLARDTAVLELFHGPTAAFKDVGARFLAECVSAVPPPHPRTVLVATSGDTGGAVASAFYGRPGLEVVVLFPKKRISPRQEKQLTCWGGNVRAFAVRGTFDDCQRLVKTAFATPGFRPLLSANSINIARILPQSFYYARASLEYFRNTGKPAGVIVPSGNLGNAVAAFWAKRMGFPIREIVLATNANRPITDYFASGNWKPQATVSTLANAMDVGNPSNMERLLNLYPSPEALRKEARAFAVEDTAIRETIRVGRSRWGRIWCPHTATAVHVREQLTEPHWIVVATADPAKFDTIVEPLVGETVPLSPALSAMLARPSSFEELEPDFSELQTKLASTP